MSQSLKNTVWLRQLCKAVFKLFALTPGKAVGFDQNGKLVDLDGVGVTVTEDELALSDNVTANASTAKHGLLIKLSNAATEVLNGQGAWIAIATLLGFDPANAVLTDDARLTDSRPPDGAAGGVLSGTFPDPGFAADMATQAELDAQSLKRLGNGIADSTFLRDAAAPVNILGGNPTPRRVMMIIDILTTFAPGDGAAPIFDIGETGTPEKFVANLTAGNAGEQIIKAGVLSGDAALVVTPTAATGTTSTGAIEVNVLGLPAA